MVNFPILTPFSRHLLRHKFPLGSTILKYTLSQSVCLIHYTWPIVSNPVSSNIHAPNQTWACSQAISLRSSVFGIVVSPVLKKLRSINVRRAIRSSLRSSRFLSFRDWTSGKRRSAPGVSKKLGRSREGWARRGSGEERNHPLPDSLFFALSRSFHPPRWRLEKERKRLLGRLFVRLKLCRHNTFYPSSCFTRIELVDRFQLR